jgi:hypothetical protein
VAAAGAHVGHVDAGLEPFDESGHERQGRRDQGGVEDGAAHLGHRRVELRVGAVGHAAAAAEALHQFVLHRRDDRDELGE